MITPEMQMELDLALDAVEEDVFGDRLPRPTNVIREQRMKRLGMLRKVYGKKLAAKLVGCWDSPAFLKWENGEEDPNDWQARYIDLTYDITTILMMRKTKEGAKEWFISRNEYLGGFIPSERLMHDALTVRHAAMVSVSDSAFS